jgi:hypothetical protein
MVITSDQRSLYDDWQLRRERLLHDLHLDDQYRQMQIQLLNFLINRYCDAPEARSPARFPLPAEFTFNERAVLVHHYLWPGQVGSTKSIFDVRRKVSGIVERMQNPPSPFETDEPEDDDGESKVTPATTAADAMRRNSKLEPIFRAFEDFKAFLADVFSGRRGQAVRLRVRNKKLRRSFAKLSNPKNHDSLLVSQVMSQDHPNLTQYALRAWRERVKAGGSDEIAERLRLMFYRANDADLDSVRAMLADVNPAVRMQAVSVLGEYGTLDDVALLSDLLALPPQPDESPRERATLRMAVKQIAGQSWK